MLWFPLFFLVHFSIIMSLLGLPDECLSQIASCLNSSHRNSLRMTHPALIKQFSPTNQSLWLDIHTQRFKTRTHYHTNNNISTHQLVHLQDVADELLLFKNVNKDTKSSTSTSTIPYTTIHKSCSSNTSPCIVTWNDKIYIAHGRSYKIIKGRNVIKEIRLDGDACTLYVNSDIGISGIGLTNGNIIIINDNSNKQKKMKGHIGRITSIHISNNGIITSTATDKTIRLRRISSSTTLSTNILRGHASPVQSIQTLSNTIYVTHGGTDCRLKLWDIINGTCISTLTFHNQIIQTQVNQNNKNEIYVATKKSINIIDTREKQQSGVACILSLPRKFENNYCDIGSMDMRDNDGLVVCSVQGGAVSIWDCRGSWEGRGLGWVNKWSNCICKCIKLRGSAGVLIGYGGELLNFSIDGHHENSSIVHNNHSSRAHRARTNDNRHPSNDNSKSGEEGICYIGEVENDSRNVNDIVIGYHDGHMDMSNMANDDMDYDLAMHQSNDSGTCRFWSYE